MLEYSGKDQCSMYNRELEERIDHSLRRFGPVTKKMMFGGISYLINGHICFGIYKESLVLRTGREESAELIKAGKAGPLNITGRAMRGWVLVPPDVIETDQELLKMLTLGAGYVQDLPKKISFKQKRK